MARYWPLAGRVSITSEVAKSMTLLRSELRPVVVARVLIPRLVGRRGGDRLGRCRDGRLDRGLDICLGVRDGARISGHGAGSDSLNDSATATRAARRVVPFVVTASGTGRCSRRGGRGGAGGGRRCAVRSARHRQHSRRDGGDADCQRRATADAHKSKRQRNLAFLAKSRQDSEIHTCMQATATRTTGGSLRRPCCQPAELTGSVGLCRRAPGASAGTTGCSGGIGASRLYGSPWPGR